MAQFDVYENPSSTRRGTYPYLVDIQSPVLDALATRIVLPLGHAAAFNDLSLDKLTPRITYGDETLLLMTPQVSSIRANLLANPVGTLAHCREQILGSLDFAVSGF